MNREPIGLYIFRFVMGLGLFAFMGLLYWSSTLVENNLKLMREDIVQLKNDLYVLRSDTEKTKSETLKIIVQQQAEWQKIAQHCFNNAKQAGALQLPIDKHDLASDTDQQEQNLLKDDPFFLDTLPKLLGANFTSKGIQRLATVGKPDNLHPFSNWSQVAAWQGLCGVSVAKQMFGKYETMSPDMALRVEERINPTTHKPEFWVFLRDDVYWQPLKKDFFPSTLMLAPQFLRKNQVTSEDYKFFFDALMNPHVQAPGAVSLRTYYDAIEEIEVVDALTFIVRWKTKKVIENGKETYKTKYIARQLTGGLRPLASFVYKYFANGKKIIQDEESNAYRTNSVWAQNFAEHWAKNIIVSCGPWVFDGMNERQIKFVRNPNFYFAEGALSQAIEVDFKDSPENVWGAFKNSHLDSYALQPAQMQELQNFLASTDYQQQVKQSNAIERLDYISRAYTYIGWNQARPFFYSAKVRRAMTMAIDRKRIIEQNLNGLGIEIIGPFYRFSSSYDASIEPWPFSPEAAKRLLQEEGWYDSDGDGILDKMIDGQRVPFRFALTYYVKNATTKAISEYIATAMKAIGIDCDLNGVDIADLSAIFDDKNFDAICLGWALGTPPEDPRQLWSSAGAREKGSSNAVGFANAEIDAIINELDWTFDADKRRQLYHRFDRIMHEEQPYTFLYTPKTALLYREYLQNVFLPVDRQDLVPGADVAEPDPAIFWIKHSNVAER